MPITFVTELGESFLVEINPNMKLEDVKALLEVESGVPVSEQFISLKGCELGQPSATMNELGVSDNAILQFRRRSVVSGWREASQDAAMTRLQLLDNPELLRQLRQTQPELADAAEHSPARFAELMRELQERQREAKLALSAGEANRQETIMTNLEHALEYHPESLNRVIMLYVPVEINSHPVKASVNSGAQSTIMSPECAEACGIMRLVDKRFSGTARGIGTAKILGRVHSAPLKLADLHLPWSFTVMEGNFDLMLGLDILFAHQACIDLQKRVLRIQGREVAFLPEHQIPDKERVLGAGLCADESLPTPQSVHSRSGSSLSLGGWSMLENTGASEFTEGSEVADDASMISWSSVTR